MKPAKLIATPSDITTTATKPGSLYWPLRAISSPLRRLWFDIEFEGLENVPVTGPVILAPNHISFIDSLILMYALKRKVLFLGKAEYTDSIKTRIFPAAGMIPVDRSGRGVLASLRAAAEVLNEGGVVGVFPEGTRARDGAVHRGHTGAAYLAAKTSAALIPVGIIGTDKVQPPGASRPVRGEKITMRFGAPMDIAAVGRGPSARNEITDQLMRNVARLARRPFVDTLLAPGGAPAEAAAKKALVSH